MGKQDNKENKTVQEMCGQYKAAKNDTAKNKILEECGIITYLPIMNKLQSITSTIYTKVGQIDDTGLAYYSGITSMIQYMLCVVKEYTQLSVEDEIKDFDALMESGLMNGILEVIGDDEEIYRQMFEESLQEFVSEQNTIPKYVQLCVQALLQPLSEWSGALMDFINENGGVDNLSSTLQNLQEQLDGAQ